MIVYISKHRTPAQSWGNFSVAIRLKQDAATKKESKCNHNLEYNEQRFTELDWLEWFSRKASGKDWCLKRSSRRSSQQERRRSNHRNRHYQQKSQNYYEESTFKFVYESTRIHWWCSNKGYTSSQRERHRRRRDCQAPRITNVCTFTGPLCSFKYMWPKK